MREPSHSPGQSHKLSRHHNRHHNPGHGHGDGGPAKPVSRWARLVLAAAVTPFVVATVVAALLLWPSGAPRRLPASDRDSVAGPTQLVDATILAASRGPCPGLDGSAGAGQCDQFTARLTGGRSAGSQVSFTSTVDPTAPRMKAGDRVRLAPTADVSGRPSYYIVDYQRGTPLVRIAVLAALVVVAVARWRGLAAVAGLALTYLVIVKFTLPALLDGRSPVAVALTTGAALLFPLLYVAHGPSARTTVALLGTLASLALAGLFGAAAIHAARITGLGSDENATLAAFAGTLDPPPTPTPRSDACPAGSSSGCASPRPWSASPPCCCATSRWSPSTSPTSARWST